MEIKMCVYCEHIDQKEARYWSTITGWDSGYWSCKCKHFKYENDEIEGWALRAMDCPDYELSHKVQEELNKQGYVDGQ